MQRFLLVFLYALFLFFTAPLPQAHASVNCTLLPNNIEVLQRGSVYYLGERGGASLPHSYKTEEAANTALQIFDYSGFYKYCTIKNGAGRAIFEYFVTTENKPPHSLKEGLETCSGFLEAEVKAAYDARSRSYRVTSDGEILVESIAGLATAEAIVNTMRSLSMNAGCMVADSTLTYWKSLYRTIPPVNHDPSQPAFSLGNLKWDYDGRGHQNSYDVIQNDLTREIPFSVSFLAKNNSSDALQVSSIVKINNTVLNQQNFSVPAKDSHPVGVDKKIILQEVATSLQQSVSVELTVIKNQKSYLFTKKGDFKLTPHGL